MNESRGPAARNGPEPLADGAVPTPAGAPADLVA